MKIKQLEVTFERDSKRLYFPQIKATGIPGNYKYNLVCDPNQVRDGFFFTEEDLLSLAEDIAKAVRDVNKLGEAGPDAHAISRALLEGSLGIGANGIAQVEDYNRDTICYNTIGAMCLLPNTELSKTCTSCRGCGWFVDDTLVPNTTPNAKPFGAVVCFHLKDKALTAFGRQASLGTGLIQGIKQLRTDHNMGLPEAKRVCEAWISVFQDTYRRNGH